MYDRDNFTLSYCFSYFLSLYFLRAYVRKFISSFYDFPFCGFFICLLDFFFFFFSSRRRHTRSLCDWSSDVCSSDLPPCGKGGAKRGRAGECQRNGSHVSVLLTETETTDSAF